MEGTEASPLAWTRTRMSLGGTGESGPRHWPWLSRAPMSVPRSTNVPSPLAPAYARVPPVIGKVHHGIADLLITALFLGLGLDAGTGDWAFGDDASRLIDTVLGGGHQRKALRVVPVGRGCGRREEHGGADRGDCPNGGRSTDGMHGNLLEVVEGLRWADGQAVGRRDVRRRRSVPAVTIVPRMRTLSRPSRNVNHAMV